MWYQPQEEAEATQNTVSFRGDQANSIKGGNQSEETGRFHTHRADGSDCHSRYPRWHGSAVLPDDAPQGLWRRSYLHPQAAS